jgi:hypothetical protein
MSPRPHGRFRSLLAGRDLASTALLVVAVVAVLVVVLTCFAGL